MNVFCRVCWDDYDVGNKEPLSLPCGHSFCRDCLRKVHLQDELKCPTCSTVHSGQALDDLPVNLDLLSICIKDLSELTSVGGEKTMMEVAEDEGYTSTTRSSESQVGRSSMLEHAAKGDVDGLTEELEQGCDVNMESLLDGDHRRTALHLAADGGHLDALLELLVTHRANVHAKDTLGRRPLHLAAAGGHHHLLSPLLEHGALLEVQDNQGVRAVHLAAEGGHQETLTKLDTLGCNLSAATTDGTTALHLAAKHGHPQVVAWLLEQGLSTSSRDSLRHTAQDYAAMNGHQEVVSLLRHGDGDQHGGPQQQAEAGQETRDGHGKPLGRVANLVKRHGLLFNNQMIGDLRDHMKARPASVEISSDHINQREQMCGKDQSRPKSAVLHSDLVKIPPQPVDDYNDPSTPRPTIKAHHINNVRLRPHTGGLSDPSTPRPTSEVHHNDNVRLRPHTGGVSDPSTPRPTSEVHHNDNVRLRPHTGGLGDPSMPRPIIKAHHIDNVRLRPHTGGLSDPSMPRPTSEVHHNDNVRLRPHTGGLSDPSMPRPIIKAHHIDNVRLRPHVGAKDTKVKLSSGESCDDRTKPRSLSHPALDAGAEEKWLEAASAGDLQTVEAFLDAGVDLETPSSKMDEEGLQALHLASWGGHWQVVQVLLDHAAQIESHAKGRRVVHWAALGGHVQVLKVLRERGCQLMALTTDGSTALHLAADYGNMDAVKWLLKEGADPTVENQEGLTPIDLAKRSGFPQIVQHLRGCEGKDIVPREESSSGEVTTVKILSAGRFGHVCLVQDAYSLLVRKTIPLSSIPASNRQRVHKELALLHELKHPYLVHCVREVRKLKYIEVYLEYCEGGDLERRIAQHKQQDAPFSDSTVYNWTLMLTLALKFLHGRALVHGDVRPHNILLTQGDVVKLQVPGLGLLSCCPTSPVPQSPEVCTESANDAKADMRALGCCLYQLATLEPYVPHSQTKTQPTVTIPGPLCEEFKHLVTSLLDHDEDRRPSATRMLRWHFLQESLERMLKDKQLELEQLKELEDDVMSQLATLTDARVM